MDYELIFNKTLIDSYYSKDIYYINYRILVIYNMIS